MTQVYSASLNAVVASGGPYVKVAQFLYDVPNCLPLQGPQVGERYTLREDGRPHISVECIAQGVPGIQTASFKEV